VGLEVTAPLHRARGPQRRLSGRDLRAAAPGSGRGGRVQLQLELTADTAAKMGAYIEAHPKGQFGKHDYRLDELGLDGDALAERFSRYSQRHDVEREEF
jgi:hypothetical protein